MLFWPHGDGQRARPPPRASQHTKTHNSVFGKLSSKSWRSSLGGRPHPPHLTRRVRAMGTLLHEFIGCEMALPQPSGHSPLHRGHEPPPAALFGAGCFPGRCPGRCAPDFANHMGRMATGARRTQRSIAIAVATPPPSASITRTPHALHPPPRHPPRAAQCLGERFDTKPTTRHRRRHYSLTPPAQSPTAVSCQPSPHPTPRWRGVVQEPHMLTHMPTKAGGWWTGFA